MDGRIRPIAGAEFGVDIPPLHPFCRCTIAAAELETEDDKTAETEYNKGEDGVGASAGGIQRPIEQRNTGKGNPNAILVSGRPLNNRQKRLLELLPDYDARVTVRKGDASMRDLSALTAETGVEYAMFTRKGERLIVRGNERMTNVDPEKARKMAADGWRWSGHTHPGVDRICLSPSEGDLLVLEAFDQRQSVICNSKGVFELFYAKGDQK